MTKKDFFPKIGTDNLGMQTESIEAIRSELANSAIIVPLIVGSVAFLSSVFRGIFFEGKELALIQFGILLLGVGFIFFHRRLPYLLRALLLPGILFFIGIADILKWGLIGMGVPLFMTSCVLMTIFLGRRSGLMAFGACLSVILLIGIGVQLERISFNFDINTYAVSSFSWLIAVIGFSYFLGIILTVLMRLHASLINIVGKLNQRTLKLAKNTEQLESEITERKRILEELEESEEKLRTIFKNASDFIVWVDENGKIIDANSKIEDMVGYERVEVIGKDFIEFPIFSPEDMEDVIREMDTVFKSGDTKLRELEVTRKDGGSVSVEVSAKVIQSSKGDLSVLASIRDITERKRAEEEKARLETQLQQAQKMEAIGTLAGGVAHDLNNVLSGIVGYPDLLLMQLPEDSPLKKPILTIQDTGKKAAAIVQDLLTLARRGVSVSEVVNLNTIIEEYLNSPEYRKLMSFHPGVEVESNLEPDLLNVQGSPVHLSKTVMNLASNAAEAMTEGGRLSIWTKNRYVDKPIKGYDYIEEGDYVVLMVSDTGTGMSSEDKERIFEPFFSKKKMGKSGTGLGMAVVWGTVKDYGGYIEIQSAVGEGTTFSLYFPVTRQKPASDETEMPDEDYRGNGETILIVDDVTVQREVAFSMLSELGYSVATVSSGEEALEYLKNNSTDLLLLDMIMDPGMDGLDTYKQILQMNSTQKAIIVSGYSETARVKEVQRLGAGKYIRKPYQLEKIGKAIKHELDKG